MTRVVTTLLLALLIAGLYVVRIGWHVAAVRRQTDGCCSDRPRLAIWLVAHLRLGPQDRVPADRHLARQERQAARRLLAGSLDKDAYRALLSAIATRETAAHPLELPRSLR